MNSAQRRKLRRFLAREFPTGCRVVYRKAVYASIRDSRVCPEVYFVLERSVLRIRAYTYDTNTVFLGRGPHGPWIDTTNPSKLMRWEDAKQAIIKAVKP